MRFTAECTALQAETLRKGINHRVTMQGRECIIESVDPILDDPEGKCRVIVRDASNLTICGNYGNESIDKLWNSGNGLSGMN